jgi:predicted RNA-binding protein with PUA domain
VKGHEPVKHEIRRVLANWADGSWGNVPVYGKVPDKIRKVRMTQPGQPCRHCGTPVIKRPTKPKKNGVNLNRTSYDFILWCTKCRIPYLMPSAMRQPGHKKIAKANGWQPPPAQVARPTNNPDLMNRKEALLADIGAAIPNKRQKNRKRRKPRTN